MLLRGTQKYFPKIRPAEVETAGLAEGQTDPKKSASGQKTAPVKIVLE